MSFCGSSRLASTPPCGVQEGRSDPVRRAHVDSADRVERPRERDPRECNNQSSTSAPIVRTVPSRPRSAPKRRCSLRTRSRRPLFRAPEAWKTLRGVVDVEPPRYGDCRRAGPPAPVSPGCPAGPAAHERVHPRARPSIRPDARQTNRRRSRPLLYLCPSGRPTRHGPGRADPCREPRGAHARRLLRRQLSSARRSSRTDWRSPGACSNAFRTAARSSFVNPMTFARKRSAVSSFAPSDLSTIGTRSRMYRSSNVTPPSTIAAPLLPSRSSVVASSAMSGDRWRLTNPKHPEQSIAVSSLGPVRHGAPPGQVIDARSRQALDARPLWMRNAAFVR